MHLTIARAAARYLASRRGRKRLVWGLVIAVAVPATIIGGALSLPFMLAAFLGGSEALATPPGPGCPVAPFESAAESVGDLTEEQTTNAQIIIDQGRAAGVPEYGWVVALATALQESGLRNLDHGDRDSRGLFQQRPSSGWGTPEQVMDPRSASLAFYGGATSPHWDPSAQRADPPGLLDVDGWDSMSVTEAAQAVQRSAFPDAYAQWESLARQLVADVGGAPGLEPCGNGRAMTCPPSGLPAEEGLTPDALRVIRCLHANFPAIEVFGGVGDRPSNPDSDHPSGRAVDAMVPDWDATDGNLFGWTIAEWVRTNAAALGVTYVIFDAQIWTAASSDAGWRPYEHPSGATDPTSLHREHVHVSVKGNAAGEGSDLGAISLPVRPGTYTLTGRFGDCGARWENCHTGLDFAAPSGFHVLAIANGTVTRYENTDGPYGRLLVIDHGGGLESWYAHLNLLGGPSLTVGTTVQAGQPVAAIGSTGNTTGPHLHLEIRDRGRPIDPEAWLRSHGVDP